VFIAAEQFHDEVVQDILGAGGSVNQAYRNEMTSLIIAAKKADSRGR
jgi:hypothetical protein